MMPLPVREAYRLWAAQYEVENAVTALEDRAVRSLTPALEGMTLLDAACGTGRRLPVDAGARIVVGVDLVLEMAVRARREAACVAVADVRALPCATGTFDIVWCRLALGHLPELERAYRELARVARPGATIIVSDFHPAAAAAGFVRSFRDADGASYTVEHYAHAVAAHEKAASAAGLTRTACLEPAVGREVRDFYAAAQRLRAYDEQRGRPLVLVLGFRA